MHYLRKLQLKGILAVLGAWACLLLLALGPIKVILSVLLIVLGIMLTCLVYNIATAK